MSIKYPSFDEQAQNLINASMAQSNYSQDMPLLNKKNIPSPYFLNNLQNKNINLHQHRRYEHDSFAADEPNRPHGLPSPYFNNTKNQNYKNEQKENVKTPLNQTLTPNQTDQVEQLIHKVQYGETLQGLSLIYSVPISRIKQRNNIDGDSIYYLKEIIIPNPTVGPLQFAKTKDVLVQEFVAYMKTDDKSIHSARYYLEQANWDMEQAVKTYKEDLEWERQSKLQIKTMPLNQKFNKKNYSRQQIQMKKRN